MNFEYKLVMFGFSAICENMDEVRSRIRIIPVERAQAETLEQCYLIKLDSGKKYKINCIQKKFVIEGLTEENLDSPR